MIILSFFIPILISLIFIGIVNWCSIKKEEYPNIKLINKKQNILAISIIYIISLGVNLLFALYGNNTIIEQLCLNAIISVLIPLSYIDWKTSLIPNRLSAFLFIIGVFVITYNHFNKTEFIFQDANELLISFVIIAISFFLLYFIFRGGIGMGDVKLISALSMFLNFNGVMLLLVISSGLILIFNLIVNIIYRKEIEELPNNEVKLSDETEEIKGRKVGISKINNKNAIVMGPFISIAFVIAIIFSDAFALWLWG